MPSKRKRRLDKVFEGKVKAAAGATLTEWKQVGKGVHRATWSDGTIVYKTRQRPSK